MPAIVEGNDMEFGDAVLNFGDLLYRDSPEHRAQDNVLRLCAYLLFANRIGLPTRHLIQNGNLFRLLEWTPCLLQDGLIFADVPTGTSTVSENVAVAQYAEAEDAEARAQYLDAHSKLLHTFDASGMMARFRSRFLSDLSESGPFRRLLSKRFGRVGPSIADDLGTHIEGSPPMRHDAFLAGAHTACPEFARALVTEWASVRYCTTPMDFDVCVREVPAKASALLLEAEACALTRSRPRDHLVETPEPMRSAIEVMDIGFPVVFTEGDARCLVDAVLKTRDAVPEAREKFASVTCDAFSDGLKTELNGVLRDQFHREQLLRTGSPALSDGFRAAVSDASLSKVIDLAAVQYSPIVGGLRAALATWREDKRLRKNAPWKTTCEYLRHRHKASMLHELLDPATSG